MPDELSFLPEQGAVLAGEAVIHLAPDVATALEASVPAGPSRGVMAGLTSVGLGTLDQALSDVGAVEVRRVHTPPPPPPPGILSSEADAVLLGTFRVGFDPARPVEEVVGGLAAVDEVQAAEPVRLREATATPNDPSFAQQWGLTKIRCPEAWDRTTGDAGVIVGVVDSGVDLDHPELAGLLLPGFDAVDLGLSPPPPLPGWVWEGDFTGRDNVPQDEVGHGTHVAGTIACSTDDGVGVAGVTWKCRLLPVKVLNRARRLSDSRVSGFGTSVDIAAGIQWAADHGARVINLSLGGAVDALVERNAIAYAVNRGCVVVVAMGNTGDAVPQFPAAYPDVLAVGAIDAGEMRAAFSTMGPHIGVSAPGVGVLSTYWDNTYNTLNGTSMATPHVSGVAALVLSCNPNLAQGQVRQIIRETARALRDDPADPVPNDRYGNGLVDAKAALDRACPAPDSRTVACSRPLFACRPESITVRCPSVPVFRCPSLFTFCVPESQFVRCPSVAVRCPSLPVGCPSGIVCPSGPVCGRPGEPGQPGRFEAGTEDPYGDDPYGYAYGEPG